MLNPFGFTEMFNKTYKNDKKFNKILNNIEYMQWFQFLENLALSTFVWKNLPDPVDPFLIEWSLLNFGNVAFVDLPNYGIVSLPSAVGGKLNLYGYPTECFCWGFNGLNEKFIPYIPKSNNFEDCTGVICYDNTLRYPYINYVASYAIKLSDTLRSINNVVAKMKTPYFIQCDEKQQQEIMKIIKDVDNNINNIFTTNPINQDVLKVLDTKVNPQLLTTLWDNFDNTFDVWKDINGLNNNSQSDKKERLLVDEINANNSTIEASLQNRLRQRKEFCDIINKKWGFSVEVEINEDFIDRGVENERRFDNNVDLDNN